MNVFDPLPSTVEENDEIITSNNILSEGSKEKLLFWVISFLWMTYNQSVQLLAHLELNQNYLKQKNKYCRNKL